jgi:hypothetical protein
MSILGWLLHDLPMRHDGALAPSYMAGGPAQASADHINDTGRAG